MAITKQIWLILCLLALASASAQVPVLRVVDGDTIRVLIDGVSTPIRLIGVDTPETVHPWLPTQPYGPEATVYAKNLLTGQSVTLEYDVRKYDRYGRELAYVWLKDGRQVNLLMAQAGLARTLTTPPNVRYAHLYRAATLGAQTTGKGLWADYPITFVDRNCRDFTTQEEAQAFFLGAQTEARRDPHRLDYNRNGVACDRLKKGNNAN